MIPTPVQSAFMDDDMLVLWRSMTPLPGDLRLYGGTALALYLNHRESTDFDFATPLPVVDRDFVASIPWIQGATIQGGPGMVDVKLSCRQRDIIATFMECGRLIPLPAHDPISAPNGVLVAHPIDLVTAKIEACCSRALPRDYEDIIAAFEAWPDWCRCAVENLTARDVPAVGRILAAPPVEVESELAPELLHKLEGLAQNLGYAERNVP